MRFMKTKLSIKQKSNNGWDQAGVIASSACAIHCAICGLLPVAFTVSGLDFLLGHKVEWAISITAIILGLGAMALGWRQHRSTRIAGLLILGIVGLIVSRGLEMGSGHKEHHQDSHHVAENHEGDMSFTLEHSDREESDSTHEEDRHNPHLAGSIIGVCAGILLLFGHVLNMRAVRRCRKDCCEPEEKTSLGPTSFKHLGLSELNSHRSSET